MITFVECGDKRSLKGGEKTPQYVKNELLISGGAKDYTLSTTSERFSHIVQLRFQQLELANVQRTGISMTRNDYQYFSL